WQTGQLFGGAGFFSWNRTLMKSPRSRSRRTAPTTSMCLSCGKPTLKSETNSRRFNFGSVRSPRLGNNHRAVSFGVTAIWQFEQIDGAGRSRAKNCSLWQLKHDECSGKSETSWNAASAFRITFQFFEGTLWHELHASF